jgi:hypothetical protein
MSELNMPRYPIGKDDFYGYYPPCYGQKFIAKCRICHIWKGCQRKRRGQNGDIYGKKEVETWGV